MGLGLGTSLSKGGLATPSIVTDSLVLKHNYAAGGVTPVSDGAVLLDGTDDYVSVADSASLSFDACSFSAWIFMKDATNFAVVGKGIYDTSAEYQLKVQSDDKIHLLASPFKSFKSFIIIVFVHTKDINEYNTLCLFLLFSLIVILYHQLLCFLFYHSNQ